MIASRWVAGTWVAAAASAVTVLAGCAGTDSGGEALPGDSRPTTAASASSSAGPASPTATAAPSTASGPYFPVNASGCHDNAEWQAKDRYIWLELLSSRDPSRGGVRLSGPDPDHFGGPLCLPERIHIQYWLVHGRNGSSSVSLESVSDNDLQTTGDKEQSFATPAAVTQRNAACDGMLLAVYAGEPLKDAEMPRKLSAVDAVGQQLFPNKRVALEGYVGPTGTATCT
ncbi:hypothetical protein ACFXGI_32975 [Streptomyces sp. NPDC059355]|uniref:hypothetical protein n=1 Tax=Streptomyces sp. NPDC059355 TaxID=3346811 RepID=UPI0036B006E4